MISRDYWEINLPGYARILRAGFRRGSFHRKLSSPQARTQDACVPRLRRFALLQKEVNQLIPRIAHLDFEDADPVGEIVEHPDGGDRDQQPVQLIVRSISIGDCEKCCMAFGGCWIKGNRNEWTNKPINGPPVL